MFLLLGTLTVSASTISLGNSRPPWKDHKYFVVSVKDKNGNPVKDARVCTYDNPKNGGLTCNGRTNSRGKVNFRGAYYSPDNVVTIEARYGKHKAGGAHTTYAVGRVNINLVLEDLEVQVKNSNLLLERLLDHSILSRLLILS